VEVALPAEHHMIDAALSVPFAGGSLKFVHRADGSKGFIAHSPGTGCSRFRTAKFSNKLGAGRPLGHLAAWLQCPELHLKEDGKANIKWVPEFEELIPNFI